MGGQEQLPLPLDKNSTTLRQVKADVCVLEHLRADNGVEPSSVWEPAFTVELNVGTEILREIRAHVLRSVAKQGGVWL
jgi:hypothetical protein